MSRTDLIDTAGIASMIGVSREHVTDRVSKRHDFPKPAIALSQKTRRWRRPDVQRWIDSLAARAAA